MLCNRSGSTNANLNRRLKQAWEEGQEPHSIAIEPFSGYALVEEAGNPRLGEHLLKQKKAGCLVVAGGQGTRMGCIGPKGCVEVLPGRSLFRNLSEKVAAASLRYSQDLPLALMTSAENHSETVDYFEKNHYFGLAPSQVRFFVQGSFPIYDAYGHPTQFEGPDGNGASLKHFHDSGIAQEWKSNGVEHVLFLQVDNALAEPFDPALLGYHAEQEADATLKAILRSDPEEKVGIIAISSGKIAVVEYNEVEKKEQLARDEEGKLLHPCANTSMFAFSMHFIDTLQKRKAWEAMPLHAARKRIQQAAEEWGYKFEYFIFDVLLFAERTKVLVYPREQCFAPIKEKADLDNFINFNNIL